jgi:hypothetical protein
MTNPPTPTPETPDHNEPPIRWYVRLGALVAGMITGAVPGTVMLFVASGLLGVAWKDLGTPFLICTATGGICGLLFPRATLDYAYVFLGVFGI